jgi:DNA-binding XRE family transcriptional regulator
VAEEVMAEAFKVSRRTYRRIERGDRDLRYVEALMAAHVLCLSIDRFVDHYRRRRIDHPARGRKERNGA